MVRCTPRIIDYVSLTTPEVVNSVRRKFHRREKGAKSSPVETTTDHHDDATLSATCKHKTKQETKLPALPELLREQKVVLVGESVYQEVVPWINSREKKIR